MNSNDYRINAYKKASGIKTTQNADEDIQPKKISKPQKENGFAKTVKKGKSYEGDPAVKAATDALLKGGLIKVPEHEKEDVYRRVAKFLILIGVDQAALVLKHLSQEETEKIIPEITAIRTIDNDEALAILEEFNSIIEKVKEGGGTHTAELILEKAFGKERAQNLMDRLNIHEEVKPFEYLSEKEPEQILELLKEESNNVRALVLSYVQPKKAADVINRLSPKDKKEVIINLAQTKKVMPEVLKRVDKAMHEKALAQINVKTDSIDGKSVLAEILKKMDFSYEQEIISNISDNDPVLGEELSSRLFTMEDMLNSDDRFLQNYLRELNDTEIAYLIGDKPVAFRDKIFSNISAGRCQTVLEEEMARKPMLKKDCNEITQKFYSHLRHAWESGSLMIKGRDDEVYV